MYRGEERKPIETFQWNMLKRFHEIRRLAKEPTEPISIGNRKDTLI